MTTVKEAQAGPAMTQAGKKKRSGVLLTGAAWIISVLFVFPVVWMIWTSFHSETDAATNPPKILSPFSTEGYSAFFGSNPWPPILNSLTASVISTVFVLCLALPAAYALSIRPVKKWSDVLFFFLSTKFMPVVAALLPVYLFAEKIKFLDNIWLLIILYTSMNLPIAVWMLRSFLSEIPDEMLEAAQVDGAGLVRTLREIIAPVIMPGIASAALICFIFSWNELLFARVLTGTRAETAPVFLTGFVTSQGLFLAQVCAASFVVSLPVLAAGFAAQDKLVQGLSMGAVR
ncbi:carbohydrate ABC transporter permease [Flexivirga sp. ID2601S]|uniref:Carbohydrate ABC transporter permease n=2 Tax=Dermacoccaceae TaxID=145357 RepID=A0A849ALG9_9MICO|nr:carbohydrate ABC transporter permease [Flexivirga aerilata]